MSGSEIKIFSDGSVVGSSIASSSDDIIKLSSSISAGHKVTATQTVGLESSSQSPDPVIVQKKPPSIGPIVFRSHIHTCGQCILLDGAVPGGKIEVISNGSFRGNGTSYDGTVRIGLNGPIQAGEILNAKQEACGESGPNSVAQSPEFPGGERGLQPPTVEPPLRRCQKYAVVSDVYDGAHVILKRSGGPNLRACFDVSRLKFIVNPTLVEGETVMAQQLFEKCQRISADSEPVVVVPAEPVPPPNIVESLCEGDTSIRLTGVIFGSKIRILFDGNEIGVAESPEDGAFDFPVPPLPEPLDHGSYVTAQQELCGIWSVPSDPVPVNPGLKELLPPKVSEPLFECGAVVHLTQIHPGSRVFVFSELLAAPIGEAQVYSKEATINVAPLLIEGDKISATQKGCGLDSDRSNSVIVQKLEDLTRLEVEDPIFDCDSSVQVRNAIPGAKVEIYVNNTFRGSTYAGQSEVRVPVIGKLDVGDQVKARQLLCDIVSKFSNSVIVEHFDGRWISVGEKDEAEILAVHAALLRTNKILYFGGDQHTAELNENGDIDHTRLFDCDSHAITKINGLPSSADLFCAGHAQMTDGKILVAGGTHKWPSNIGDDPHGHGTLAHFVGSRESWIFDPSNNGWHKTESLVTQRSNDPGLDPNLDIERTGGKWYPTLVTLPDGKILAVSGHPREFDSRHNNNTLEWFNIAINKWEYVGNTDCNFIPRTIGRTLEYPRLLVLSRNDLLSTSELNDGSLSRWQISSDPNAWIYVTSPRPDYGGNPLNHTSVLLPLTLANQDRPRILICGKRDAWVLDPYSATKWYATSRKLSDHPDTGDFNPPRNNLDAVILPTGEIFVEGGVKDTMDDDTGVKKAEMFDPEDLSDSPVGTWRVLPEAKEVRNYHSVALLMPNGAVWVAGSDIDSKTGLGNRNLTIEIFEPWYFCQQRPIIEDCPDITNTGSSFIIRTHDAYNVRKVVIVRCGSCTHNFNPDQRLVELSFESKGITRLIVHSSSTSVLIPGYYLLFIITGKRVPSKGKFIQFAPNV